MTKYLSQPLCKILEIPQNSVWHVVSYFGRIGKGNKKAWRCLCICGVKRIITEWALKKGKSKSCGCKTKEFLKTARTRHGLCYSRQYGIWQAMKERCTNKKKKQYKDYGGRGITYDPRWQSFEVFWEDMKPGYDDKLTLDREDNDLNYNKSNCRWATWREQQNNRANNRMLTYNNKTLTVSQWSQETGILSPTIRCRIDRYGWTIERALTTQAKKIITK